MTTMSEGAITYRGHGEVCGITTVLNSQLRNHRVCEDGLACMETSTAGGSSTGKQCRSVLLVEGDRCSPVYDSCFGALTCAENVNGYFTCGGSVIWDGNEAYVDTGYVQVSEFKINVFLVVCGVLLLIVYLLLLLYIGIYENSKGGRGGINDVCVGKLFRHVRGRR